MVWAQRRVDEDAGCQAGEDSDGHRACSRASRTVHYYTKVSSVTRQMPLPPHNAARFHHLPALHPSPVHLGHVSQWPVGCKLSSQGLMPTAT